MMDRSITEKDWGRVPDPRSETEVLVETVREAVQRGYHKGGHHPRCTTGHDEGCDCYARATAEPRAALTALAQRIETLERERDKFDSLYEAQAKVAAEVTAKLAEAELLAKPKLAEMQVLKAKLAEAERALETICEIGETRDVEVARAALRSLRGET